MRNRQYRRLNRYLFFTGLYNGAGLNCFAYKISFFSFCFAILFFYFLSFNINAANHSIENGMNEQQCSTRNIQIQQKNSPHKLIKFLAEESAIKFSSQHVNISAANQYSYRIVNKIQHDQNSFTQGLLLYKNKLYESSGLLGQSKITKINPQTGEVVKEHQLKKYLFAEGVSVLDNELIQLTWKTGRVISYDPKTLAPLKEYQVDGESWGVTTNNKVLFVSDGTSVIKKLSRDFNYTGQLQVHDGGVAVQGINELEYASGYIYANVWPTDCVAKINSLNGEVVDWINLSGLYPENKRTDRSAVLNGIAFQENKNNFFITGKYWPYIYEVEFVLQTQKSDPLVMVDADVKRF